MSIYSLRACLGIFNKRGLSLIAVIIVMLIVATLALVVSSVMSTGNISSVTDMQAQQAFYLAQAGMEWYMEQLENDSDWSSPPTVKTDQAFGAGTFSVSYSNEAVDSIDVHATGKVTGWDDNSVQRVITQHMQKADFEDFAIYYAGGDGTIEADIAREQTITGDTFIHGDLDIGRNCTITGNVFATGGITIGSGTNISGTTNEYTSLPAAQISLDTTYYDDLITTASGEPSGNVTYNNDTLSGTDYINGNVTVRNNLFGSGTIVATGTITINRNAVVADDISFIADNTLQVNRDATIGTGGTFYSSSDIDINNGTVIASGAGTGEGVVLLSPGDIDLGRNITMVGFVFGDDVTVSGANLDLTGNMSGNRLVSLIRGAVITKDHTKIDFPSIEGFNAGVTTIIIISSWQESL